jgi:hypothetical protein
MAAAGGGAAACVGLISSLHEFIWRLEGLTLASFTGAAVGDKLRSPPFHAGGFEWQLSLAPRR